MTTIELLTKLANANAAMKGFMLLEPSEEALAKELESEHLVFTKEAFLRDDGGWRNLFKITRAGHMQIIKQRLDGAETDEQRLAAFIRPNGYYDEESMYILLDGVDDLNATFKASMPNTPSNPLIAEAKRANSEKLNAENDALKTREDEVLAADEIDWNAAAELDMTRQSIEEDGEARPLYRVLKPEFKTRRNALLNREARTVQPKRTSDLDDMTEEQMPEVGL